MADRIQCLNHARHWFTHTSLSVGGVGIPSPTCIRQCGAVNPKFDERLAAIGWDRAEYKAAIS